MRCRWARFASIAWLLGSAACGSLLGIEDVHEGPPPGASAGANAEGGVSNPTGGSAQAGASVGGAAHGGNATQGGSTNHPSAGEGGSAGEPGNVEAGSDSGGAHAEAGTAGASQSGSPVHGRVIDFWGHLVSGVPVQVDGKKTTTDASGSFSIDDVKAEYDASVVVQYLNAVTQTHAYLYQGLTRRDPTLQVYRAYADSSANLDTALSNSEKSLTSGRILSVAMGGKDGNFERRFASPGGASMQVKWVGPITTTESVFGLVWQPNATTSLPEGYFAFATTTVDLDSTNISKVVFDLDMTPQTLATATVSGSVVPANSGTRSNSLSVRFPSGANIRLVNTTPTANTFSYVVPTLANASVAFAAVEGCVGAESCAIVHKEGAPGADLGALAIPTPATGLALNPPGAVDSTSAFSFTLAGGNARASVSILNNAAGNDRLVVITSKPSFKIPALINGSYALVRGASYTWTVTTHGDPGSVDELAAPSGYIDSFGFYTVALAPNSPTHTDGSFTSSARQVVTVAN